jgi:hypothetical protein
LSGGDGTRYDPDFPQGVEGNVSLFRA